MSEIRYVATIIPNGTSIAKQKSNNTIGSINTDTMGVTLSNIAIIDLHKPTTFSQYNDPSTLVELSRSEKETEIKTEITTDEINEYVYFCFLFNSLYESEYQTV